MKFALTHSGSHPVIGDSLGPPVSRNTPVTVQHCQYVFMWMSPLVECEHLEGHVPWHWVGSLCFVKGNESGCQIVMDWWAWSEVYPPPASVSGTWLQWQTGKNWIHHKKKFSQSIHVQVLLQSMMGRKYGTSYTGGWNRMKGQKLGLIYSGNKKWSHRYNTPLSGAFEVAFDGGFTIVVSQHSVKILLQALCAISPVQ